MLRWKAALATVAALALGSFADIAEGARLPYRVPVPTFTVYVAGETPGFAAGSSPLAIVGGPDGNVWFTEATASGGDVAKISPAGRVTAYATGAPGSSRPLAIVTGRDGNLWFSDPQRGGIGRITPFGAVSFFSHGLSHGDVPAGLASARDGSIWFVSAGAAPFVGRIDLHGNIAEVAHLGVNFNADPSIGQDRHGGFVFTANDGVREYLIRVNPRGGSTVRELPWEPGFNPCCVYTTTQAFASRSDGSLWFTNLFYLNPSNGNHPLGKLDEFGLFFSHGGPVNYIGSLVRGRGNDLWFANQDPFFANASIGTVGPDGGLRVFAMPFGMSPLGIAFGSDDNLWMTASNGGQGLIVRATP